MAKLTLVILVSLQAIFGTIARPDNYRLSEEQITRLKDISAQWKEVINWEKKTCDELFNVVCSNREYPKAEKKEWEELLKDVLNAKPNLMTESEEKFLKYATMCEEFKTEEKDEFIKSFKFDNIGNWPAFEEKWDESKFNLPLAIVEMDSYNYPVVFSLELTFDSFKTHMKISKEDLVEVDKHKDVIKSKFEILGVKNPEEVLADAVLFEKTYNEAAESVKSTSDIIIKFSEFKDYFPEVDWNKQIEIIYERKLREDYSVLLKSHEQLKNIYGAISKLSPKVIANYFFCAFVNKINDLTNGQPRMYFTPVVKQALMKHVYTQDMKDILKGMHITILEIFQKRNILVNLKSQYTSEQIAEFINDIFGLSDELDLANQFKEVSLKNNECVWNYHRLQKLYKKRTAEPLFDCKNALVHKIRAEIISNLVNGIPEFIEQPSPVLFQPILFSIIRTMLDYPRNTTIFPPEQRQCFAKQYTNEFTIVEMEMMEAAQLVLKTFSEWNKNYPDVVQEENKILQDYDLSAETLLVISFGKYACGQAQAFNAVTTAFANTIEFSKIIDCPVGSKLNPVDKCSFW